MLLPSASAVGEPCESSAAQASASPSNDSGEADSRSAMPSCSASVASTLRPEKISALAVARPVRRGRKYMPPPSGIRPRWMYDHVKLADSAAMTKSQAIAMSAPRPLAPPLTAAMVGLGMLCSSATE
ncbi:hypothetical protein D3C86_1674850 [compost metagenome]